MNTEKIKELRTEADPKVVLKAYADNCKDERDAVAMTQSLLNVDAGENDELNEDTLDMVVGGMSNFRAIQIVSDSIWDIYVLQKDSTRYSMQEVLEAFNICEELGMKMSKGLMKLAKWLYTCGF